MTWLYAHACGVPSKLANGKRRKSACYRIFERKNASTYSLTSDNARQCRRGVCVRRHVLLVEQAQHHARAPQLDVHRCEVRLWPRLAVLHR
jgi:hypothetical protein